MNDILGFMMDGDYTAFDWVADQFLTDEHEESVYNDRGLIVL